MSMISAAQHQLSGVVLNLPVAPDELCVKFTPKNQSRNLITETDQFSACTCTFLESVIEL